MIQRSAILTALSMAARETAGFSTLPRPNIPKRVDFPSKVLPPALHDRYLTEQDVRGAAHAGLLLKAGKENVMNLVLKKKGATDSSQAVSRQRQLRPGNPPASSARGLNAIAESAETPVIPFKDIAAEYFILPMINRFWTYFQDELARESRAAQGRRGFATGTGMILSPMALSHFISALTIMLHAAQHSPAFLAILAPEGLELAIALGTQMGLGLEDGPASEDAPPELESDVVGASLELALVCLSGSKELDGGRSLVREHITSVMAAGEWASGVFGKEQKGESTTTHKGGGREDRIRRTAASVVITVKDVVEAVQR
jgi:telomere length regulation protein